jgi:thioredoxin reductase (NADPH)
MLIYSASPTLFSIARRSGRSTYAVRHLHDVLDLFMEKVIIVGSGCAGLTAAIYAARASLNPLVLEGRQPGGQLSTTTLVENYPGFPRGIEGPQLILEMHDQAEKFGTRFSYGQVDEFEPKNNHVRIKVDDEWLETETLIIASGAAARWLGLEDEEKLVGHGLTSCATCDGAFYKNVPVAVVGGGDSAAEESLFLTRFASKVYLIHRRDQLRASKIMADRVLANPKIEPIWNTVVTKYIPDEKGEMRAILLRDVKANEETELPVSCVFVAIGHTPNTKPYRGKLDTDPDGYLIPKDLVKSKLPNVFIAGDVADRVYKQAVTAAGAGCAAALEAEKYLSHGAK